LRDQRSAEEATVYRIVFRFSSFEITSYSVMLALSVVLGVIISSNRAGEAGFDSNRFRWMTVALLISSLLGARLAFAVLNYKLFLSRLLSFSHNGIVQFDGLVLNGGLFFSVATIFIYAKRYRLSIIVVLDVIAPCFGLGLFFTRIGCFLNGCCFGTETEYPWGVSFPANTPAGHYQQANSIPMLYPTQLYCAIAGLFIFFTVLIVERAAPARKGRTGNSNLASLWSFYLCDWISPSFRR
jgi:phosphatidylglycerol---prolipoprotein diacylglyceryl transferase